ncbi:MAG: efflux RND transporter periplasmic adaptor subunit [Planctomycetes bacterium]|nr:efflux RND transporter periplasmic adaptor subunit [Planctomycetota bacterium]
MPSFRQSLGGWISRIGRAVAVGAVVLIAGGAAAWLASGSPKPTSSTTAEKKEPDAAPKLRRTGSDTVVVPAGVQASLGLKTAPATAPTRKRTLPAFQGTLNFDNGQLARVQSPFAGLVVDPNPGAEQVVSALPSTKPPLPRVGDRVNKGDVLAVVWSKDLGEKKSEFVDAVAKLKTDEETLRRLEDLYQNNGTAERTVREQERTVKADRVAVERAEATLRAWRIDDIPALRAAADQLASPDKEAKRTDPATWARVEIKAPIGGVILERNVAVGQVVDTTSDLFRVGDLSTLAVWVHVYEEDLALLRGVDLPRPWTVSAPALPGSTFSGRLERIGASIDPVQHTALVTGTVDNPNGELRAGMAVSVTVELDVPKGEVELPAEAVVEDGRESFVFVRTDPSADTFVRRPVAVVRRSRDVISVAARSDGPKPGDLVVTSGSLLLGDAFGDLPQPK